MSQSKKNNLVPIVVAISGGGRTLKNLIERESNYKVVGVISSTMKCKGIQIAKDAGLPIFVGDFAKAGLDLSLVLENWLISLNTQWIILGGFLKKFPILKPFESKVINIHPALLPKFGGKGMYGNRVHRAVIEANEQESGATVHFLTNEYDKGKIIAQKKVKIAKTDDADILSKKVFAAECALLPDVVSGLIKGNLPLNDGVEESYHEV